jgi:hypothetical protein
MATKTSGIEKKTTGQNTAQRANEIWESEGRPHGRDQEHWNRAESELNGGRRTRKVPPTVAAAMTAASGEGRSTRATSKTPPKKAPTGGRKKS